MEGNTFVVYQGIINDVLEKVRADFQAEGVDERTVDDLRMMWESKLLMTNAIQPAGVLLHNPPPPAALEAPPPAAPQNAFFATDLNYPPPPEGEGEGYESKPILERDGFSRSAAGTENKPSTSASEAQDVKRRRLSEVPPGVETHGQPSGSGPPVVATGVTVGSDALDGWRIRGGGGDEDDEEDYNEEEPEKPPVEVKAEVLETAEGAENDEDDLNELDDEDEQREEDEDEAETTNIVLAQFEKVTRTKNKWKCVLKEGVIKLNGRDILFNKANGEFVW